MGIVADALRSVLGRSRAVRLAHDGGLVRDGVAEVLDTLRVKGRSIIDESWPGTAVETLPEWHTTMGVAYDPTARSVAEAQVMLAAMESAVGGSTLANLQAQLDKEFGGRVVVGETYIIGVTGLALCGLGRCGIASPVVYSLGYTITGTVYSSVEAARVAAILERYAPAHLEPNSLLTDLSASAIATTGLGRVGIARTGLPL